MKLASYMIRDCYDAQISGMAFVNIQFRYTLFGIALKRSQRTLKSSWWTKLFPIVDININKHTGQLGQVYKFRFRFMNHGIQYKTKGEAKRKGGWRGDYGFKFVFCGRVVSLRNLPEWKYRAI